MKEIRIGIADTTFARVDMGRFAVEELRKAVPRARLVRYTVPGVKDLPLACKRLIERDECDIVLALGMAGPAPVDKTCTHEASLGLQRVQLDADTHVLEVFVHMDEVVKDADLYLLAENRTREHARNAAKLLAGPSALTREAGKGRRQGFADEGAIPPPRAGTKLGRSRHARGL
ncbi:MAG: riboflavin synthase [Methanobacteriota archaeon]